VFVLGILILSICVSSTDLVFVLGVLILYKISTPNTDTRSVLPTQIQDQYSQHKYKISTPNTNRKDQYS
jgi:hypothetical protein